MCCPEPEKTNQNVDIQPKILIIDRKNGLYIDEALILTNFGAFNYFLIVTGGLILNAVFLETCGMGFVLPVSECDLSLSSQQKGILGSVSFLGMICSAHFWGFLADTTGRKKVMQPTLMIAFFLSVASSFVSNFYVFATLRFFNGFFISASSATMFAYLGEFHSNVHRGRAIMGSALIFGVACLLLPLIAWCIINQDWAFHIPFIDINYKPWRMFIIVCGIPGLLTSIALIYLPESPKFVFNILGDQSGAIEILKTMNRWNNRHDSKLNVFEILEETESIENRRRILANKNSRFPLIKSVWTQTAPLFHTSLLRSTLLICSIQFGIYATSNGFFMFFADIMNRMAHNLGNNSDQRLKMCDIINMVNITKQSSEHVCVTKLEPETLERGIILESLYAIGFAVIGLLIDKVGKFPILLVVLGGSGGAGIICMLSYIPSIQMYSFIALLCCGMAGNIISAAAVDIYPTSSRAMAISIALLFGRIGSVFGSNTFAYLLNTNCEVAFYLSASSVIGCAFLSFFVPNIHQRSTENIKKAHPRSSVISTRN